MTSDPTAVPTVAYGAEPWGHDEMVEADGTVRPGWRAVADDLGRLRNGDATRRAALAHRLLVGEGAGHVVHDDEGAGRVWRFDPVPLLLHHAEWVGLERGLVQRARLLEALLTDLIGERRLLTAGVVPVAAVVSWAGYQRATLELPSAANRITLYGPDLVRTAGGRFVVLADHTDVPVGAGLALLQRSVSTRLLPELHRRSGVAPLTDLSAALRSALAAHAPPERRNPRVLVHTTGPGRPEYLDHSYLAAQVGYHVVAGDDLTARGGRLWLRSLGELEPVDVVLRRVPDPWVDPLEVPPGGPGGVAGLLQAVRERGVGVTNTPGAALAGHLPLLPFLPAACEVLLGEELALPSIETWWCGLPEHREEVLGQLGAFVLHDVGCPTPTGDGPRSVFADHLDGPAQERWTALLADEPHRVVAQRRLALATTPTLLDGALAATPVVLRAVVVCGPDGTHVLPGGHARVIGPGAPALAQESGLAKDVWVVGAAGVAPPTVAAPSVPQIDLRASLPSRAGESLFWMGRNAERAETAVRLVQVVLRRVEQEPDLLDGGPWLDRMLAGLRSVSGAIALEAVVDSDPVEVLWREVAEALDGRPGSAADAVRHLVSSARSIREHVSTSTWQIFGMLEVELGNLRTAGTTGPVPLGETLDRVLVPLLAFSGLAKESMVRGPGWRLLDIGRRLERALLLLGLLEATVVPPIAPVHRQPLHESVLTACESLVAYRRRFRSDITLAGMTEMLVGDAGNPRSLAFQLEQLADDVDGLPPGSARSAQRALVERAQALVAATDWEDVTGASPGLAQGVQALVLQVRPIVLELAAGVVQAWFAHAPQPRQGAG